MAIEAQWLIHVTVNGQDLGVWDTFGGGDTTTKPPKHRPGGMGPEIVYVGLRTYSDITVSKVYDPPTVHELVRQLMGIAGTAPMTVSKQPLDADGNAYGNPIVYQGVLSSVKPGKADSNSETLDLAEIDMTVATAA